jgi:hypothetical protein
VASDVFKNVWWLQDGCRLATAAASSWDRVWVGGGGGERAEQVAHVSLSEGQLRAFLV